MENSFYIKYLCIVFLVVFVWIIFLTRYRKKGLDITESENRGGAFLIGPLYYYLREKGFALNKREIIGWIIVILLMIVAPLFIELF